MTRSDVSYIVNIVSDEEKKITNLVHLVKKKKEAKNRVAHFTNDLSSQLVYSVINNSLHEVSFRPLLKKISFRD